MLVISSLLLLFVDETIAWSLGVLDLSGPSKLQMAVRASARAGFRSHRQHAISMNLLSKRLSDNLWAFNKKADVSRK
jgi:hypothetical protein